MPSVQSTRVAVEVELEVTRHGSRKGCRSTWSIFIETVCTRRGG